MADGTKEYPRRREKKDKLKLLSSKQARRTNALTDVQAKDLRTKASKNE